MSPNRALHNWTQLGFESADFDECSDDVAANISVSESGAAQVVEATDDNFGRAVRGVGASK